jgi:predicted 3-demethylubiquinone-9 3-methyltransferase (glyoxalase superfamily)
MEFNAKVRTCFGFNGDGHVAADFYVSLLPDSRIENTVKLDPNGPPLVIEFTLGAAPYMILNDGPPSTPSVAASISVLTNDQDETDRLWAALTADGGEGSYGGWLKDRYGVSWQIVPEIMPRLLSDTNRDAAGRAMQAMMQMGKLDIAALEAAFRG